MRKFNANINLPRNILTLEDEDIQLQNFSNIASKGRLSKTQTFKPHTMSIIYVTPKRHYMNQDICYQISSAESPHIQNEPGLYVMNTITKVHDNGLIPCILVNNTGKTYNFVRGNYIAKITPTPTDEFEISEINSDTVPDTIDLHNEVDPKYSIQNFDADNLDISSRDKTRLKNLISEFEDVFAAHATDIGKAKDVSIHIPLKQDVSYKPIQSRPFRIPLSLQDEVQQQIQNLLKYDIIEPSQSPWSFPLVTVEKKDRILCLCIDFRRLNLLVESFSFSLANFDTVLGNLSQARVFSTLDLNQAYLHLAVDDDSRHLLSFITEHGKFQYKRLCFGLNLSAPIFCEHITRMLRTHSKYSTSWVDDILCHSPDINSHFIHL